MGSFLKCFRVFFGVAVLLLLCSCSHAPKVKTIPEPPPAEPAVTGAILDPETLKEGGDLALVSFKAGPKAEADDELDRLSAMILKGIKDSIDDRKSSFHIVDANETQPKIALQGYVEEFSKTGKMSRMMMRPNEDTLSLVGEVWLISSGERLLNFATSKKFNPKKQKPKDAAYAMGQDIGNFICDHGK